MGRLKTSSGWAVRLGEGIHKRTQLQTNGFHCNRQRGRSPKKEEEGWSPPKHECSFSPEHYIPRFDNWTLQFPYKCISV